jgi:hypothetical protein
MPVVRRFPENGASQAWRQPAIGSSRARGARAVDMPDSDCCGSADLPSTSLAVVRLFPGSSVSRFAGEPHAKLRGMNSQRPLHVTLTGDRSGDYVIVEERPDGSLLVAPETSRRSGRAARQRAPGAGSTLLSEMLFRSKQSPTTVPEALQGWGVELREDELVWEFLVADVDGRTGYVAVTSQRFIFVAQIGRGLGVAQEHLLSSARDVEFVRRGMKHKLRVTWNGSETLIGASDRHSLSRLQQLLASR